MLHREVQGEALTGETDGPAIEPRNQESGMPMLLSEAEGNIRDELKRRRHEPIRAQGQWLTRVVSGYFNYHAVPGNLIRLGGFRLAVCRLWRQALKRRSQRNRLQWSRYGRLADLYIPRPRNAHPYPEDRFASLTRGRSRMR